MFLVRFLTQRTSVSSKKPWRFRREEKTIRIMTAMYCRFHAAGSAPNALCHQCKDFLSYAQKRIDYCRYGVEKPACSECPTHCYIPTQRETVRKIMLYAGPKIMFMHPLLALFHVWDKYVSRLRVRRAEKKSPSKLG